MNEQQAAYVLDYLVRSGRVSPREISRIVAEGIRQTEDRLNALRDGLAARAAPNSTKSHPVSAGRRPARRRRRHVSPEVAASRQLQGRYIALLRQLPQRRRARISKIAKDEGREAAIKAMQKAK
jgi:hypothetical protein